MLGKSVSALALASMLCACANSASITTTSAAYNKAMADIRNEQLLLNIMRATAREPLQFSTLGDITTTYDRSAGLDSSFNNFLAGGANAITQVLKLGGGNKPVTKLTPMSQKEFIGAMLRPTAPETLKQFMDLGWDPEFMLPLLVAGYRCPKDTNFTYISGTGPDLQKKLDALSEAASSARWTTTKTDGEKIVLDVRDEKALEMVRSGVAKDYKVKTITPDAATPGKSVVTLTGPDSTKSVFELGLCPSSANGTGAATVMSFGENSVKPPAPAPEPPAVAVPEPQEGQLVLRSVEGIIYFLGQTARECYLRGRNMDSCALSYVARNLGSDEEAATVHEYCTKPTENAAQHGDDTAPRRRYLLRILSGPMRPQSAAIGTRFYGTAYWISRLDQADCDRTVKTFSFLNQLIALQTEPSAIGTTPTVLPVGN